MGDADDDDGEEFEHSDDRVRKAGTVVAWVDWDSGGPGAGAGRVTVYEFDGAFYVDHDAGMDRYDTFEEAVRGGWIWEGEATTRLWVAETYKAVHRALTKDR